MRQFLRTGLVCLFLTLPWAWALGAAPPGESTQPVCIGVLASLTGTWSSLGQNTVAGLQIAVNQLNAEAQASGKSLRLCLDVYDTQLLPNLALAAIEDFHQRGGRVIIGPQSSAEVAAIAPYADAHQMLVISQGSTASSLAIVGDNIYRFCPDDGREATAIVALMWHDGIRTLVPIWRDDAGNDGLHDSVQKDFQALGGTVLPGYQYAATTTDFGAATDAISGQVANARLTANASTIGIYLAAFDEVVGVFHSAQSDAALSTTKWYGSDGVALSAALQDDAEAAAFAVTVGYPNPIFGLNNAYESRWLPISNEIQQQTGIQPDAYALSAYDALFVVDHVLQVGGETLPFVVLRVEFVNAADFYVGVTGPTSLDPAGDRLSANFDFWEIRWQDDAYTWARVGGYQNGTLF